jgi:hypothetical protein
MRLFASFLFLLLAGQRSFAEEEAVRAFFGPRAADDKEGVYLNLLRFIDSAKKSIHASCHEVDMISVAEALAAKKKSGIDVQVVEADWWGNAKNPAAREVLEDAKIPVYPDTKKSGLMPTSSSPPRESRFGTAAPGGRRGEL